MENIYIGSKCETYITSLDNKFEKKVEIDIKLKIKAFYVEICEQIIKRFNFGDNKLKMFSYFTPEIATSGEIASDLGVVKLFPHLDKAEEINEEWRALANLENFKYTNVNDFWNKV